MTRSATRAIGELGQPGVPSSDHRLRTIRHLEFAENIGHMIADGFGTELVVETGRRAPTLPSARPAGSGALPAPADLYQKALFDPRLLGSRP